MLTRWRDRCARPAYFVVMTNIARVFANMGILVRTTLKGLNGKMLGFMGIYGLN
ncbi:MAG: hypothetical protein AAGA60_27595 [Cyanobacteria bacterium P01_E01_bin.42]